MMDEILFLERKATVKAMESELEGLTDNRERTAFDRAIDIVCEQVAADVVPVVHGYWVEQTKFDPYCGKKVMRVYCSECGKPNRAYKSPYCPHCPAKMDKLPEVRE